MAYLANIKQLQQKLTSTAVIEIPLLNDFHRSVKRVMIAALTNGVIRINQGTSELIIFEMTKL